MPLLTTMTYLTTLTPHFGVRVRVRGLGQGFSRGDPGFELAPVKHIMPSLATLTAYYEIGFRQIRALGQWFSKRVWGVSRHGIVGLSILSVWYRKTLREFLDFIATLQNCQVCCF